MIQRTTPLQRTSLSNRRTRIAAQSDAKKAAAYAYSKKRKTFLRLRPICQRCEKKPSRDVHHVKGRYGSAYLDEHTWLAVCRACHDWIHQHPREAREQGLWAPLTTRELMQERAAR